jgi:LysR family transcriptional regulator, transcriptional activator of the cysJI operon
MPMEDHRLKAFCLVVEMKSFSKAAEAKMMTQSAMSHLIKNLEDEMGVKLLNRSGKKVIPTPAGWLFYKQARNILEAYKTLGDDINKLIREIKGPLNLGASTIVAKYLLPQVVYNFLKRYPEVQINLTVSNTEAIVHELQQGNSDICIVEGNIENKGISLEEIANDEIVLIASDENPLTKKEHITQQDFLSQSFIMPQTGSGLREFIEDFFQASKIEPKDVKVSMTLGDPELIVQMVQSGLGISFISKWSIFKPIKEGTIRILKLPGKSLYRKFYLVSLCKEPSTMVAKAFRKFIKEFRFFIPF